MEEKANLFQLVSRKTVLKEISDCLAIREVALIEGLSGFMREKL